MTSVTREKTVAKDDLRLEIGDFKIYWATRGVALCTDDYLLLMAETEQQVAQFVAAGYKRSQMHSSILKEGWPMSGLFLDTRKG